MAAFSQKTQIVAFLRESCDGQSAKVPLWMEQFEDIPTYQYLEMNENNWTDAYLDGMYI